MKQLTTWDLEKAAAEFYAQEMEKMRQRCDNPRHNDDTNNFGICLPCVLLYTHPPSDSKGQVSENPEETLSAQFYALCN